MARMVLDDALWSTLEKLLPLQKKVVGLLTTIAYLFLHFSLLRRPSQQGKVAKPDGGVTIMQDVNLSKQRARRLRKNMTEAERKLWGRLRGQQLGMRFRRQVVLGRYIVDFVCLDPKIIIEVDGSQHADDIHYDKQRTKWLESLGYRVLRYWNNDVLQQVDAVLEAIKKVYFDLPPHPASPPSPAGKAF